MDEDEYLFLNQVTAGSNPIAVTCMKVKLFACFVFSLQCNIFISSIYLLTIVFRSATFSVIANFVQQLLVLLLIYVTNSGSFLLYYLLFFSNGKM